MGGRRRTTRSRLEAVAAAPGIVVAGRYRLGRAVGSGGASIVYAATDAVTGARVAVKLLRDGAAAENPRVRREVAALQLLRIPGVVALLDDGVHDGTPFLVMELVPGEPFPGPAAAAWDDLSPMVLSLLETLARVHGAGVVHRDLKPSNVLVGPDGRVTVLDFGVSWGPALGASVTMPGTVVGTPEYLAPEQMLGRAADPRSDLYAVGVMIYEALTGHLPHVAREYHRLLEMKRATPPAPLRAAAPGVRRTVAEVVDRLLAIDPLDRPQSAGEASRLLFGADLAVHAAVVLRPLGDGALLARVVADAMIGRSVDVWGPVGSGRTRMLSGVAARLETQGRSVRWVPASAQPYGSLSALLGGFDDLAHATRAEAESAIATRLAALLAGGTVLVADDAERLDAWSSAALERARGSGVVVRAFERALPGGVEVPALSEADLRPLFAGPDRLFHLQEDGARELWRRTGGLPGLVASEVAAWVRAHLAQWKGDELAVGREALTRLRGGLAVGEELLLRPGPRARSEQLDALLAWIALAWPHATLDVVARASGEARWRLEPELDALVQDGLVRRLPDGRVQPLVMPHALEVWDDERRRAAHRSLAGALAEGTPLRLRHFAAAGDSAEVVREALLLAPVLIREGRSGDAQVVLARALEAARDSGDAAAGGTVLVAFAWACIVESTPTALERALYECARLKSDSPEVRDVEALLRGARDAIAGDAEAALPALAKIPPLGHEDLELWRHALRVRAALRRQDASIEEVLASFERWAKTAAHPRARANLASWRALHLYHLGRAHEAAQLHLEAAAGAERVDGAAVSYLNAALAFLETGDLAAAGDAAESARRIAERCRVARLEGWALVLARAVEYRAGRTRAPETELVASVGLLEDAELEGIAALTEAAVAWRSADLADAERLAARAGACFGVHRTRDTALLARALELVCSGKGIAAEVDALAEEAAALPEHRAAAQILSLLGRACAPRSEALSAAARERARGVVSIEPAARWEVLAPSEI